jgi:hypothetical protein
MHLLLALFAAWAPRRLWRGWPSLPCETMAVPAAVLGMLLAAWVGLGGFLDYATRAASGLTDAALEAARRPGASGHTTALPLLASATSLPAFLFFTPRGLFSLYLGLSSVLRFVAALTGDPMGDPAATVVDAVVHRKVEEARVTARERERHALEGAAVPDVLVEGAAVGLPHASLVVVASREKPDWTYGTFVVTAERWYKIGRREDRQLGGWLRALYPLSPVGAAEVIRRSVAYELPQLSTFDPATGQATLVKDPHEESRAWQATR